MDRVFDAPFKLSTPCAPTDVPYLGQHDVHQGAHSEGQTEIFSNSALCIYEKGIRYAFFPFDPKASILPLVVMTIIVTAFIVVLIAGSIYIRILA